MTTSREPCLNWANFLCLFHCSLTVTTVVKLCVLPFSGRSESWERQLSRLTSPAVVRWLSPHCPRFPRLMTDVAASLSGITVTVYWWLTEVSGLLWVSLLIVFAASAVLAVSRVTGLGSGSDQLVTRTQLRCRDPPSLVIGQCRECWTLIGQWRPRPMRAAMWPNPPPRPETRQSSFQKYSSQSRESHLREAARVKSDSQVSSVPFWRHNAHNGQISRCV